MHTTETQMIYNRENIQTFDVKQYNRIFAFGCSFTNYYWPTWADIIAHENPTADYNNRAMPGAGNEFILANLSQAMRYFNIGENDLVLIMWSTFYRHDAYRDRRWHTPGNIYSQDNIPHNTVITHLDDVRGFAIKDLAIIDTTMKMLESQACDSVCMWGVSPQLQNYYGLSQHPEVETDWKDVEVMYKDLDGVILPDLLGTGCNGHWAETFEFLNEDGTSYIDYHPKTLNYYNYLTKIGINLSKETAQWSEDCDKHTSTVKERNQLKYLHKWYETL